MSSPLDLRVVLNQIPVGYADISDYPIFLKDKYLSLSSDQEWTVFHLLNNQTKRVEGKICFGISDGIAFSQPGSPYGGFYITLSEEEAIDIFLQGILHYFSKNDVREIFIRGVADPFYPNLGMITQRLIKCGFKLAYKDVNHQLIIDQDDFTEKIHQMEKRKWKKCRDGDYLFEKWGLDRLNEVYQFIANCRKKKGLTVNITYEKLVKSIDHFPENYHVFVVIKHKKMEAALIAVKVSDHLMYYYLPASNEDSKADSPMVYLLGHFYQHCQLNGINVLDLGISSIEGQIQKGLSRFKENIGGFRTAKPSFVYKTI